jgi:hypothetical protein
MKIQFVSLTKQTGFNKMKEMGVGFNKIKEMDVGDM